MRPYLYIAIAVLSLSCGRTLTTQNTDSQLDDTDVIVHDSMFVAMIYDASCQWIYEQAQPAQLTRGELLQMERLLRRCVRSVNADQTNKYEEIVKNYPHESFNLSDFTIDIGRYKRQYVTVITPNGDKEVWVNCFCNAWGTDWRREIIQILDGGNCYFSLKINLTSNSYHDFVFPGEA